MASRDLNAYDDLFKAAGEEYGIDPALLKAHSYVESGINVGTRASNQGAVGIMQMLPATARGLGVKDPYDPAQAIRGAAKYIAEGFDATGSAQDAVRYYHGGPDRRIWGPKTNAYVDKVAAAYDRFSREGLSSKQAAAAPADAPAQTAEMSPEDLVSLYGGGGAKSATSGGSDAPAGGALAIRVKPGSPAGEMSPEDLVKLYGGNSTATAEAPATAEAAPHPGMLAAAPGDGIGTSLLKNIGTAAVKGVGDAAGLVNGLSDMAGYLAARGASAVTGTPTEEYLARQRAYAQNRDEAAKGGGMAGFLASAASATDPRNTMPTSEGVGNRLLSQTGEYVPTNALERAVQMGARAAVGSIGPGSVGAAAPVEGLVGSLARMAPVNAASGAAGGTVAEVTGDPLLGIAAGAAPALGAAGVKGAMNRLTGAVSPETAALGQAATQKYGIPLGSGDLAENGFARYFNSAVKELPLSGAGKQAAAQSGAFNRAVANTFGESADKVTPAVMAKARDRIGNDFEAAAKNTPSIHYDQQFATDLKQAFDNAQATVTAGEMEPVQRQIANVLKAADPTTNTITGEQYQALTKRGTPLDAALRSSNPNIKSAAGDIRDALDGAFERSAPPEVLELLTQARKQWKALRTVEPLVAKAPEGDISPALLQGRVNATNKGTYGTAYGGGGDLKELADIGQRFLKPPPNSGTASRVNVANMLTQAAGAAAAVGTGNPLYALSVGGTLAGQAALGRFLGSRMRNPEIANRLIQQGLNGGGQIGGANKLLNLLPLAPSTTLVPQR